MEAFLRDELYINPYIFSLFKITAIFRMHFVFEYAAKFIIKALLS